MIRPALTRRLAKKSLFALATISLSGCMDFFGNSSESSSSDNVSAEDSAPAQNDSSELLLAGSVFSETVTGPGRVEFSWRKTDATPGHVEPPSFRVNGSTVRTLRELDNWIEETIYLPAGTHELSWQNHTGDWLLNADRTSTDNDQVTAEVRDNAFAEQGQPEARQWPEGYQYWSELFSDKSDDDDVVIEDQQIVIMDEPEVTVRSLMIHGELLFDDSDSHLKADWIHVHGPNARLEIGTSESPISSNIRITLTDPRHVYREIVELDSDKTGSSYGQVLWHVDERDDTKTAQRGFGNYKGLMVMDGATLSVYSTSAFKRSWTQLAEPAEPGDTSLTLLDATGWEAGDRIALAPTGYVAGEAEQLTIQSVDGKTLYLQEPVQYHHSALVEHYQDASGRHRQLDMRAEVGLLSRNVVIEGDDKSVDRAYGAHTMFMYPSTVNISGLELRRCGQRASQGRYCSHWHRPYVDNMEAIYEKPEFLALWERTWDNADFPRIPDSLPETNPERWHWYMAGPNGNRVYSHASEEDRQTMDRLLIESIDATGDYIRNSSIHQSFQRAVNLHGTTGVVVDNNVAYNISNHAFVHSEDGGEFGNIMSRNLAILVNNVRDGIDMAFNNRPITTPDDLDTVQQACFENLRQVNNPKSRSCQEENKSSAFWGENPFNTLIDNVAAGVRERGNGFFYGSAVVTRTNWDDERGLYLMSGREVRGDGWRDRGVIAPAPMIFANNRAHTISMTDEEPELGFGDQNVYPPEVTGMGFFFRRFSSSRSEFGPGDFIIRDVQGYGFQDHGLWIEPDMHVDGCVMGASYKRLVVPQGHRNNIGIRNCVLLGETTSPQLASGRDDGEGGLTYTAFGPNYGRSSDDFRPFIHDTIIYQHGDGLEFLDWDGDLDADNVDWVPLSD